MNFVAIDPGSSRTGFAVFEFSSSLPKLVSSGTIALRASDSLTARLAQLNEDLNVVLDKYKPTQMAIESVFVAKNARTALHLGQARGVILMTAGQRKLEVFEYSPAEIKRAVTGMGRAQKDQVQKMIRLILKIPSNVKFSSADQADALAIGLTHARSVLWKGPTKGRTRDRTAFWQAHL